MKAGTANGHLQPGLYLTATPIGNAADISLRAMEIMRSADVLLCEDTRSTVRLLSIHGIRRPAGTRLLAYHDHSDDKTRAAILEDIASGAAVALVSEAGTPLVSDPGYKLVLAALERSLTVTCVPGACAAVAALTVSGLAPDRFFFAGFSPPRSSARRKFLRRLKEIPGTLIFYESPHRIAAALEDMAVVLGARDAVIVRELTKRFEELHRGDLNALARDCASRPPKGELVVLVSANENAGVKQETSLAAIESPLRLALDRNSLSAAVRQIAETYGLSRSMVYRRALELRESKKDGGMA